jgi:hypothetical protein
MLNQRGSCRPGSTAIGWMQADTDSLSGRGKNFDGTPTCARTRRTQPVEILNRASSPSKKLCRIGRGAEEVRNEAGGALDRGRSGVENVPSSYRPSSVITAGSGATRSSCFEWWDSIFREKFPSLRWHSDRRAPPHPALAAQFLSCRNDGAPGSCGSFQRRGQIKCSCGYAN